MPVWKAVTTAESRFVTAGGAGVPSGKIGLPVTTAVFVNVADASAAVRVTVHVNVAEAPGARLATDAGATGLHAAGPMLSLTVTLVSVMFPVFVATYVYVTGVATPTSISVGAAAFVS